MTARLLINTLMSFVKIHFRTARHLQISDGRPATIQMVNRSRVDIVAAILKAAQNGAMKTRLMYDSRISFLQLDEYLKFLLEREMIQHVPNEKLYRITDSGRSFLDSYYDMWEVLHRTRRKKAGEIGAGPATLILGI